MFKSKIIKNFILYNLIASTLLIGGCGSAEYVNGSSTSLPSSSEEGVSVSQGDDSPSADQAVSDSSAGSGGSADSPEAEESVPSGPGTRDSKPVCLVPEHPGTETYGNELCIIDTSNSSEGYVCVSYTGTCQKVKLQITCPNTTTYTYNLSDGYEVFPLTTESGTYSFGIYENITDTQYSTAYKGSVDINITNPYGPYLYPNQYVSFKDGDMSVAKGEELSYSADSDLDVVTSVYNFMIDNITYDAAFANSVESGYLPTPDNTLATGTGICLDYAALMASMLRSQRIPTHLEVGYAGTAYHAWISVYLEETGWVNGIIEFNGTNWELMDPTFASSASEKELKEFIGDGSNYETKYIY